MEFRLALLLLLLCEFGLLLFLLQGKLSLLFLGHALLLELQFALDASLLLSLLFLEFLLLEKRRFLLDW